MRRSVAMAENCSQRMASDRAKSLPSQPIAGTLCLVSPLQATHSNKSYSMLCTAMALNEYLQHVGHAIFIVISGENQMDLEKIKTMLVRAYEANVEVVRRGKLEGDGQEIIREPSLQELQIPILSGSADKDMTACVEEFANEKKFKLFQLDRSQDPVDNLIINIAHAVSEIYAGKINGCVILILNFDKAGDEWQEILDLYASNYFNTPEPAANDVNTTSANERGRRIKEIPEKLLIVGVQPSTESLSACRGGTSGSC